ncbi:AMP-dependent synthetase and ligase [Hyaloraphidium curvatum]|nr:AMP-dependent synthetase and ligase [Hyaloraphidium curvatum]
MAADAPPQPVMTIEEFNKTITAPGSPFETEEKTIRGLKQTVWKNALRNIPALFKASKAFADRDYLTYTDPFTKKTTAYTYGQAHRTVALLAKAFERWGVKAGDKVSICSRNNCEWVIFWWASVCSGCVTCPINSWLLGPEMSYCITLADTSVLVVDEERMERLVPELPKLKEAGLKKVVLVRSEGGSAKFRGLGVDVLTMEELLAPLEKEFGGKEVELPDVDPEPEEDATILFTSGTTGFPKGALGTHRGYCTNLINVTMATIRAFFRRGEALPEPDPKAPQSVFLLGVPLFHVTGCFSIIGPVTQNGGKLVIMYKWDAGEALRLIHANRVTGLSSVPAQAIQLLEHPDFEKYDTSSVLSWGVGGAATPAEIVGKVKQRLPQVPLGNGYGATETSSVACSNGAEDYRRKPTSVGVVPPVNKAKIVDPETLQELPRESIGEIWLYGPNVIKAYYKDPKKTEETFPGGWYRTGDVGRMDDEGFIYVMDRIKEVIIRGGENIYTATVENAILAHPGVLDCAVLPIPHRVLGEEVAAVVQAKPGWETKLTDEDVIRHARTRLGAFQVPVYVEVWTTELPKNANGKTLKREMKDAVAKNAEQRRGASAKL